MSDGRNDHRPVERGVVAEPTESLPPKAPGAGAQTAVVPRRWQRELVFAAVAIVLVLGLAEVLLRFAGFRFSPVPILVDATWGPEQVQRLNQAGGRDTFQPDDVVFWSLIPGIKLDDRTVNERGLLHGPLTVPKPPATYRILCLGDSCTAMGSGSYPAVLQKRLDLVARPDRRFEVINAGVFSYSSTQGLRLYRHRLGDLEPDLVTVYFGWNDHFLTTTYSDRSLGGRETPLPSFVRLLRQLRLYQLVQCLVNTMQLQAIAKQRAGHQLFRVGPEDYRENLKEFVDLARRQAARPVLFTAPGNHGPGRVPDYYIVNGLAESEESIIRLHRQYNDIVRDVARKMRVEVLDLEEAFNRQNKDDLFIKDGIHPNAQGRHLIAKLFLEKLGGMGVLSAEEERRIADNSMYDSTMPNLLRSRVEFLEQPLHTVAGKPWTIGVKVANTGDTVWLAQCDPRYGQVELGVIVYDTHGQRLVEEARGRFPRDVKPGETVELRWRIAPLDKPGEYVLEIAPVAEYVAWFKQVGDKRTTTSLIVEPAPK